MSHPGLTQSKRNYFIPPKLLAAVSQICFQLSFQNVFLLHWFHLIFVLYVVSVYLWSESLLWKIEILLRLVLTSQPYLSKVMWSVVLPLVAFINKYWICICCFPIITCMGMDWTFRSSSTTFCPCFHIAIDCKSFPSMKGPITYVCSTVQLYTKLFLQSLCCMLPMSVAWLWSKALTLCSLPIT